MIAINGIYNGKDFIPLDNFPKKKKFKVVITFIEEIAMNESEDIRNFSAQTKGLSFWKDEREDIYQDYLEKM
ncbi:MAG: hypothetical protein DRH57_01300 [Candidatus Cloacimonadota bacterium]|nr:MAG: hypothetical protein DRH57_01300 [Candidatus Cloacimonadota bacterium]